MCYILLHNIKQKIKQNIQNLRREYNQQPDIVLHTPIPPPNHRPVETELKIKIHGKDKRARKLSRIGPNSHGIVIPPDFCAYLRKPVNVLLYERGAAYGIIAEEIIDAKT